MIERTTFTNEAGGIRLDAALLMRFPSVPRAFIREACTAGDVRVDGRPAQKGLKLHGGEMVEVIRLDEAQDNHPMPDRSIRPRFSAQTVEKTYLALVEGSVAVGGTLENDLVHMPGLGYCKMVDVAYARLSESERTALAAKALHAVTTFRPIGHMSEGNEERTLLEVTIYTGVTHQIRAQLALAGMHIVNDRLYGAFAVEGMTGHCLHALAASFRHPVSGGPCEIRTRFPDWVDLGATPIGY